jgi:hypothetical protein
MLGQSWRIDSSGNFFRNVVDAFSVDTEDSIRLPTYLLVNANLWGGVWGTLTKFKAKADQKYPISVLLIRYKTRRTDKCCGMAKRK